MLYGIAIIAGLKAQLRQQLILLRHQEKLTQRLAFQKQSIPPAVYTVTLRNAA